MLSARDIREITFSKAIHGYKVEEVDILLDKVLEDYEQNERMFRAFQEEIAGLKTEIEGFKSTQDGIQTVLINAQKLADNMIAEARQKSEEIIGDAQKSVDEFTAKERELAAAFEQKAAHRKQELEKELEEAIHKAQVKATAMEKATKDSIERQQLLFDKIKLEIAAFKADINRKYKEQLELLDKIPDEVPMDPKRIAQAVSEALDRAPEATEFTIDTKPLEEEVITEDDQTENGFIIEQDEAIENSEE